MLHLGADHVRILLFRECEWRGRKLLFDSMTLQKQRSKSENVCAAVSNGASEGKREGSFNIGANGEFEVIIIIELSGIINRHSEMLIPSFNIAARPLIMTTATIIRNKLIFIAIRIAFFNPALFDALSFFL